MATSPGNENGQVETDDLSSIKRKLAWRMGIAALMIVGLLGGLAFFDSLTAPKNEPEPSVPAFTEPVPVAKKSITQPVMPAEPVPPGPNEEKKSAAPEATAAPTDKSAPPLVPSSSSDGVAQSSSSRPGKPVTRSSTVAPTIASVRPVEPKGSTGSPASARSETPGTSISPAPSVQSRSRPVPVLPRLLSGYSLQAGVFADPRRAEELRDRLLQEGIPSTIEARVVVGPFKNREEADAARAKLQVMGIDSVQLPKGGKK